MLKVMTIVGTRPEIIKLSRIMVKLDKYFNHILVHTGQNYDYELNEIFFKDLGLRKPDYFLSAAGENPAQTIGKVIITADKLLDEAKPDAILIYGDTNSSLAVIPAKRRKIPVFHMEAGNRAFDERVPEDINRKIIDHLSDINMPLTEHARRYLLAEGIKPETVIKTGSTMKEVLTFYRSKINKSQALKTLKVRAQKYFLVSAHREENIESEKNFKEFLVSLNAIAEKYKLPIIVSTHPRTRKKLEEKHLKEMNKLITFMKPLGFFDYVFLQEKAFCVVSDSGTISEESSLLRFPAVMIRQAHERPEGMDEGAVIMSGLNPERVLESIKIMTSKNHDLKKLKVVADYNIDNVSDKVVRIIMSYTDYVNRTVWKKEIN